MRGDARRSEGRKWARRGEEIARARMVDGRCRRATRFGACLPVVEGRIHRLLLRLRRLSLPIELGRGQRLRRLLPQLVCLSLELGSKVRLRRLQRDPCRLCARLARSPQLALRRAETHTLGRSVGA